MMYLGDYAEDATLHFKWNSFDSSGASITRSTNGTIYVYKDDATGTEVTTGITDTEDFDSLTGIHHCKIDLSSAAFYATGADYTVVLKTATIDTQTVNAVLAHFSIENRFDEVDVTKWLGTAAATPTTAGVPEVDVTMLGGSTQSATDLKDFADAGYDPATNKVEGVKLVDTTTTNTDMVGAAPTAASVADAVWDEDIVAAHTTSDTAGKKLNDTQASASAVQAELADGGRVDNLIDGIQATADDIVADTNELQLDLTDGGRLDLILDSVLVDTGTTVPAAITALDTKLGTPTDTDVSTDIANVQTTADAVETDTQDIQTTVGAIASDLPVKLTKNAAFTNFMFKMVDSSDGYTPEISKTITAERSLDGAAFASCANSATEVSDGWYKIDLDATDTNGDIVVLKFAATGCRATEYVIITQTS